MVSNYSVFWSFLGLLLLSRKGQDHRKHATLQFPTISHEASAHPELCSITKPCTRPPHTSQVYVTGPSARTPPNPWSTCAGAPCATIGDRRTASLASTGGCQQWGSLIVAGRGNERSGTPSADGHRVFGHGVLKQPEDPPPSDTWRGEARLEQDLSSHCCSQSVSSPAPEQGRHLLLPSPPLALHPWEKPGSHANQSQ